MSVLKALCSVVFFSLASQVATHTHGCTLTHMVQLDDGRETNLDLGYVIGRPAKPSQMRRSHSANRSSASLLQLLFCLFFSSSLSLFPSLLLLSLPLFLLEAVQVEMQNNEMQMRLQLVVLEGVAIRTDICLVAAARWRLCALCDCVCVCLCVCVASLLCVLPVAQAVNYVRQHIELVRLIGGVFFIAFPIEGCQHFP